MSWEVTHPRAGTDEKVSLTFRGVQVFITTGLPDGDGVIILIPPDEAEAVGEALARIPGGTLRALTDELEETRAKLRVLTDERANLERERDAAWKSAHAQNAEGGKARSVVAAVARVLGVDLHEGDGSAWDEDHMRRVVDAAQRLKDDRAHWETEAAAWQSTAVLYEETKPADDVDALRATIVRQAQEITELKGERA